MKKLKKVAQRPHIMSKKRKVFLSLRKNQKKKSKIIKSFVKIFPEIQSPHNTTNFLIANNSSSFLPNEDDLSLDLSQEFLFPIIQRYPDLIKLENNNEEMKDTNLELRLASTSEQSKDFHENKISLE